MAEYLWAFAIVAAVCLMQVPAVAFLTRYFRQDREGADPAVADADDGPNPDLPAGRDAYEQVAGVCSACGTDNDPEFDYCQECFSPLSR